MQEASGSRADDHAVGGGGPPAARAAFAALDRVLARIGVEPHRPAPLERGFTVPCGDWPLHVGARVVEGLLAVQAEVAPPGTIDPSWLLHRNRRDLRLVRFGSSAAGATWVHGELPLGAADDEALDALLGRLLSAAEAARAVATRPEWA
ncbi:hypothetical protein AB0L40_07070 [Patulibacter sp. NPDC049589]|uniref:hypothetical protein n=1 Tax=Patulibacter sp. NPDC049589 TaxID=3154731 RepID=UPI00343A92FA